MNGGIRRTDWSENGIQDIQVQDLTSEAEASTLPFVPRGQCKCGSTNHQRTSHSRCPLKISNKGSQPSVTQKGTTTTKPKTGSFNWKACEEEEEYTLLDISDARDEFFLPQIKNCAVETTEALFREIKTQFVSVSDIKMISPLHVFMVLARSVIERLLQWTNCRRERVENGPEIPLTFADMLAFIATYLQANLRGIHSNKFTASNQMEVNVESFARILRCISAVDPNLDFHHGQKSSQTVDTVAKMREFENLLFRATKRVALTSNQFLVIDDEFVGSRSKSVQRREISRRKAGMDGLKNDSIADSTSRILFGVQHTSRVDYFQIGAVESLLVEADKHSGMPGSLRGTCGTGDGGYSKESLWIAFLSFGMTFLAICNTNSHPHRSLSSFNETVIRKERKQKQTLGQKNDSYENILDRAAVAGMNFDAKLVIDDDPKAGPEIFGADGVIQMDGVAKNVTAVSFRDYQGSVSTPAAKIVRFIASGDSKSNRDLLCTICMDPMALPRHVNANKEILFFPCASNWKPPTLRHMERYLREKCNVKPLTCWQRCADWFTLRLFCITGTASSIIARRDRNARALLVQSEPSRSGTVYEVPVWEFDELDSSILDHTEFAPEIDDSQEEIFEATSRPRSLSNDEDSDDDEDQIVVDAEGIEDEDEVDLSERESFLNAKEFATQTLLKSWLFTRGVETKEMKSGSMNEENLMRTLLKQKWCKEAYHIGLVAMKDYPFLAVSSDGVARVVPTESSDTVVASVEFKTRSAPNAIHRAAKVASQRGRYFSCIAGDEVWWDAVPYEYRGQVIHQAVVLGVDYVLFVEGTLVGIAYACLINVTESSRRCYRDALLRHRELMEWAHQEEKKDPPEDFDPEARRLLKSHHRLWRAIHRKVVQNPVHPVRVFQCLAQVRYNSLKGGLDGHTQYVQDLTNTSVFKLNIEQLIALRGIRQLVANSFILYRMAKVCVDPSGRISFCFSQLKTYRESTNRVCTMKEFAYHLVQELFEKARTSQAHREIVRPLVCDKSSSEKEISLTEALEIKENRPKKRPNIMRYYSSGMPKRLRLSSTFEHVAKQVGFRSVVSKIVREDGQIEIIESEAPLQPLCVLCGGRATMFCSTCGVALHVSRTEGSQQGTCFYKFHNLQSLTPHPHSHV